VKCPECLGKLEPIDCKGIEIDECTSCRGRWFDRDELRKAKDKQDDDIRWLDFDPFGKDAEESSAKSEGKICPKCSKMMSSLKYHTSSVIIDKCDYCGGVWLDHGEFERIIEYLEDTVLTKSAKDYAKDNFRQFVEIFTGPKGTITEIKDFLAVLNLLKKRIGIENPKVIEASQKIYKYTPFK